MTPMEHYRVYHLDRAGHITRGDNFEFAADADALAFAESFCADAPAIEVWQSARFVGRLPAHAPAHEPPRRPSSWLFHRAALPR